MNKAWLGWLAGLLLLGCEAEISKPDLLPADLMRDVLVEMHVADAYTERSKEPLIYRNDLRVDLYEEVLKKFSLDEQTFRHTYDYYTSHPAEMDSLYQQVIEHLDRQLEGERQLNLERPLIRSEDKEPAPKLKEIPARAPWQKPDGSN